MNAKEFQYIVDGLSMGKTPSRDAGGNFQRCCPSHGDSNASLSLRLKDDKILIHCHAGCEFKEIKDALLYMQLWPDKNIASTYQFKKRADIPAPKKEALSKDRLEYMTSVWNDYDKNEKPMRDYMKSRGLNGEVPVFARYNKTKDMMVNPILKDGRKLIGIHRTYLNPAPGEPRKKIFGSMAGGIIRLTDSTDSSTSMAVGEGVETAMAWSQATGMASISSITAGNIVNAIGSNIPMKVRSIHILEDHDLPNEKGQILSMRFYDRYAEQLIEDGYTVYRHHPKIEGHEGKLDWLDVFNEDPSLIRLALLHALPECAISTVEEGPAPS